MTATAHGYHSALAAVSAVQSLAQFALDNTDEDAHEQVYADLTLIEEVVRRHAKLVGSLTRLAAEWDHCAITDEANHNDGRAEGRRRCAASVRSALARET